MPKIGFHKEDTKVKAKLINILPTKFISLSVGCLQLLSNLSHAFRIHLMCLVTDVCMSASNVTQISQPELSVSYISVYMSDKVV